ncbi:hypothetical protein Poli38472_003446 [Pythium oligandrum]|uniref:Uncharacterized protein n=1 Tax=Pythium oligandrum TaxID=41045 RepID=A0A8K1C6W1_PYTOL|nr:hypothetical protein Poli38472_003446 [Pythium oligandrum]|eukprot:TMW57521.1 hypothetical protein Poli38472_003446 [Pythium oligandrum]
MPAILAPGVGSPGPDGEENDTQPVHYEIVQSRSLPRVDMYKTLKLVLLGASGARVFTQAQRRYGKLVTALYVSGLIISIAMLLAPAPVGRPIAAIATTLEFPILVMGIMSLRPEMIRVLLRTYEFWFFSVMSVGALISMVFSLSLKSIESFYTCSIAV